MMEEILGVETAEFSDEDSREETEIEELEMQPHLLCRSLMERQAIREDFSNFIYASKHKEELLNSGSKVVPQVLVRSVKIF
uniref:Uncharacterized protein n=1 Tax=Cannabis sativa TaxID=3483 RepID=A0A803RC05_CANSA